MKKTRKPSPGQAAIPNGSRRLGWREWVELPDLGVRAIKAKLDTGARTSSLHAFRLHRFSRDGVDVVRFEIHPVQRSHAATVRAEANVLGERRVRTSGGQEETRIVIETTLGIGSERWPIELTLTRRDDMGFRMLLGRQAMTGRILVDPSASFLSAWPARGVGGAGSRPATMEAHKEDE